MYITAAQLLQRFGARELAQSATPDDQAVVETALLRAVIAGSDTSGWDVGDVAIAEEALSRITDVIADADQVIDMHLRRRYTLPLSPVPTSLVRVAGDLCRYLLVEDRATDEIRNRYEAALKLLKSLADGSVTLGADDPAPATGSGGAPQVTKADSVFSRDSLQGYF
jgi:phage gp36-like protein